MNKSALFFILMLLSTAISAQVSITGKVVDEDDKIIEFVEIILLTPDTVGLQSQLADENGVFNITAEPGDYILQIQQMSKVLYFKEVTLNENIDLGIIKSENTLQLDEVVVSGRMKLVERKIDRMVFNVENSSSSAEGDALGVLRVTPGVQVQNDLVSMVGKSKLAVLINDKLVELEGEDLTNFLRSISSEDIKNIEIITIPPAKYDAMGNSGLVNIQLKKAKKDSWNATLGANYTRNTFNGGGGMASFNFNKKKWSIASSLSSGKSIYHADQDDYAYFEEALWYTAAPFDFNAKRTSGRLDVNYDISPKWSMGAQYLFNYTDNYVTEYNYTPVIEYDTDKVLSSLTSSSFIDNQPILHSANWNSTLQLDTSGRTITVNLDYFNFKNPDVRTYDGISLVEDPSSMEYYAGTNLLDQAVENYSGKIDFDLPTKWVKLGVGGKFSISNSRNDISLYNSGIVAEPVADYSLTENKFEYDENVEAVYISANKKLSEKWETQLGLRMEATQTATFAEELGIRTENNYIKFFPTAYISFTPNEKTNYSLSYSRRITRPSFNALNPNLYFVNPFQTIEGNAYLQPAFTDNVELSNTYRGLVSKVYFSYEENLFYQVPIADPATNFIRFTNENHITNYRYGISESYIFDELKWWTSSNNVNFNYTVSESSLSSTEDRQAQFNGFLSSYNDFTLNPKGTIVLNVGGWYRLPSLYRFYDFKAQGNLAVGLQWYLLDKSLKISVKGNDLLKTQRYSRSSTVNDVYQEGIYYYDSRSFNVSLSYKFGNASIRAKRHEGSNEDARDRTEN